MTDPVTPVTPVEPAIPVVPEKTFTQTELDAHIKARLGRETANHEKALKEALEKANLGELEAANAKLARTEAEFSSLKATLTKTQTDTAITLAALTAGVPADKIAKIIRLTEYTPSEDGTVDAVAIKASVDALLTEIPELIGKPIETVAVVAPVVTPAVPIVAPVTPVGDLSQAIHDSANKSITTTVTPAVVPVGINPGPASVVVGNSRAASLTEAIAAGFVSRK